MANPINLPSKQFNTQKEAISFFKDMLNSYQDGQELTPEDSSILFELLQRHPEAEEKIGVGIENFYRDRSATKEHPTSCFHIERIDKSYTDFSYITCIKGYIPTSYQHFYQACHYAVLPFLLDKKDELFQYAGGTVKCAKTGEYVTIDNAEYRHTSPKFKEIVDHFIAENNLVISQNMVTQGSDMQYVTKLIDKKMESEFILFHSTRANLAIYKKYVRQ